MNNYSINLFLSKEAKVELMKIVNEDDSILKDDYDKAKILTNVIMNYRQLKSDYEKCKATNILNIKK